MQQPNSAETTALLEVFRIGLINTILDKQHVIAWADEQIELEAEPAYFLIELALSGSKNINDTISLLHNFVGESKPLIAGRIVLGYLYQQYTANNLSLQQVATTIYWLGLHYKFSNEEHHFMRRIDMEYDLAADGYGYGSIAEAEKQIIRFTALYEAFNLENGHQWPEIDKTIPEAVQSLYQNIKPLQARILLIYNAPHPSTTAPAEPNGLLLFSSHPTVENLLAAYAEINCYIRRTTCGE